MNEYKENGRRFNKKVDGPTVMKWYAKMPIENSSKGRKGGRGWQNDASSPAFCKFNVRNDTRLKIFLYLCTKMNNKRERLCRIVTL